MRRPQTVWPARQLKHGFRRVAGPVLLCFHLVFWFSSAAAGLAEQAPVQVILALDTSGSMKQSDPLRLLPNAAAVMVNLLEDRDSLGLIRFDESPEVLLEPGPLLSHRRRQCLGELKRLAACGPFTDIPLLLDATLGAFEEPANSPRALILITDGQVDIDPRKGSTESSLQRLRQEIIPAYQKERIAIYTVAFTVSPGQPVLRELAAKTHGSFLLAENAAALHGALVRIYEKLKHPQLAPLVDNRFVIDPGVKQAVLIASRKSSEQPVKLTDPRGRKIGPRSGSGQVCWFGTPAFDMVTLTKPRPGTWEVNGIKSGEGTVTLLSDLRLVCPHIPEEIGSDEELIVGASISDHGRPVIDAEFLKETVFQARLAPERGDPLVAELATPPLEQRRCWPPGTRTASFPPLGVPGSAELTVRVQGKAFQRERRFFLRVVSPWLEEEHTSDPDTASAIIRFQPGRRGLPGDVRGWVSVLPATGGVGATWCSPGAAGGVALTVPGHRFRPAKIAMRLAGVTPAGRPVAIRPGPVQVKAPTTGEAVAGLSQKRFIARLKEKLRRIRARFRLLGPALKTKIGKAAVLFLLAGALAAGLLLTRRYWRSFFQRSPGIQAMPPGDHQDRLLFLAQVENLQKEKAELAVKLGQLESELKQAAGKNAGLMAELERQSQGTREKAKIIADLEKKVREAAHEAEAVQQEYMALYARSQGDKGVLKKG